MNTKTNKKAGDILILADGGRPEVRVGDQMVYDGKALQNCHFEVVRRSGLSHYISGRVTKTGMIDGVESEQFVVGATISFTFEDYKVGKVKHLIAAQESENKEISLSLTREEAAALAIYMGKMSRHPTEVWGIYSKLISAEPKIQDALTRHEFNDTSYTNPVQNHREKINELVSYIWPAPKKKTQERRKTPDGKWAPKNYRVVTYPEHGTGKPVKRHVLWGDFVKGTKGTNVYVEEWCADSKKWCPKTYSLAKVGVVE